MTFLELLLASSLILLTLATLFGFYTISLQATDKAERYALRSQQARVVLQQMAREIRQATSGAAERLNPLRGTMHSLSVTTAVLPDPELMYTYGLTETPPEPSSDFRSVEYFMAVDEEQKTEEGLPEVVGLVRRERRLVAPQPEDIDDWQATLETRVMSAEIQYVRFQYFDGASWTDFWLGGRGNRTLPQAVKIEVGFASDEAMFGDQELASTKQLDLLGNPEGESPAAGRYSVIVRLPGASPWGESRLLSGMQGLMSNEVP